MDFVHFYKLFQKVAEEETRIVTVFADSHWGLPADEYGFVEMFCGNKQCDCRRVFFNVMSERQGNIATIAFGWEPPEFYARWLPTNDASVIKEMMGPTLNRLSPQSEIAPKVLKLFKDVLLVDADYIDRVKRHYKMMKDYIDCQPSRKGSMLDRLKEGLSSQPNIVQIPKPLRNLNRNIGRNSPCPCGSGKKFKQCCLSD
ncbi:MAG: SEC-C domain-containing protein [Magnetococcales bacterium]|nr:SEC-C domain-containing protein [Magnetococcales bacterium]